MQGLLTNLVKNLDNELKVEVTLMYVARVWRAWSLPMSRMDGTVLTACAAFHASLLGCYPPQSTMPSVL